MDKQLTGMEILNLEGDHYLVEMFVKFTDSDKSLNKHRYIFFKMYQFFSPPGFFRHQFSSAHFAPERCQFKIKIHPLSPLNFNSFQY